MPTSRKFYTLQALRANHPTLYVHYEALDPHDGETVAISAELNFGYVFDPVTLANAQVLMGNLNDGFTLGHDSPLTPYQQAVIRLLTIEARYTPPSDTTPGQYLQTFAPEVVLELREAISDNENHLVVDMEGPALFTKTLRADRLS